jgi:hypothetical protein
MNYIYEKGKMNNKEFTEALELDTINALKFLNELLNEYETKFNSKEIGFSYDIKKWKPILDAKGYKFQGKHQGINPRWITEEEYEKELQEKPITTTRNTSKQLTSNQIDVLIEMIENYTSNEKEELKNDRSVFYDKDYEDLVNRSFRISQNVFDKISKVEENNKIIPKYVIFNRLLELGLDSLGKK